jgi:hypothetical protein
MGRNRKARFRPMCWLLHFFMEIWLLCNWATMSEDASVTGFDSHAHAHTPLFVAQDLLTVPASCETWFTNSQLDHTSFAYFSVHPNLMFCLVDQLWKKSCSLRQHKKNFNVFHHPIGRLDKITLLHDVYMLTLLSCTTIISTSYGVLDSTVHGNTVQLQYSYSTALHCTANLSCHRSWNTLLNLIRRFLLTPSDPGTEDRWLSRT